MIERRRWGQAAEPLVNGSRDHYRVVERRGGEMRPMLSSANCETTSGDSTQSQRWWAVPTTDGRGAEASSWVARASHEIRGPMPQRCVQYARSAFLPFAEVLLDSLAPLVQLRARRARRSLLRSDAHYSAAERQPSSDSD